MASATGFAFPGMIFFCGKANDQCLQGCRLRKANAATLRRSAATQIITSDRPSSNARDGFVRERPALRVTIVTLASFTLGTFIMADDTNYENTPYTGETFFGNEPAGGAIAGVPLTEQEVNPPVTDALSNNVGSGAQDTTPAPQQEEPNGGSETFFGGEPEPNPTAPIGAKSEGQPANATGAAGDQGGWWDWYDKVERNFHSVEQTVGEPLEWGYEAAKGGVKGFLHAGESATGIAGDNPVSAAFKGLSDQADKAYGPETLPQKIAEPIARFYAGQVALGGTLKALGAAKLIGSGFTSLVSAGGGAALTARDSDENLSNLVESFPSLQNPITGFLAVKGDDSLWVKRLKAGAENAGIEGVTQLIGALRSYKAVKAGDGEAAIAHATSDATAEALPSTAGGSLHAPPPDVNGEQQLELPLHGEDQASFWKPAEAPPSATKDLPKPGEASATGVAGAPNSAPKVAGAGDSAALPPLPSDIEDHMTEAYAKQMVANRDAIKQYGSVDAATAAGHDFSDVVSMQYFKAARSKEDVFTMMHSFAKSIEKDPEGQLGKTVSVAQTMSNARQIAADIGQSPDAMLADMAKNFGDNPGAMAAKLQAANDFTTAAAKNAFEMAQMRAQGTLGQYASQEEFDRAFAKAIAVSKTATNYFTMAKSEAGRTLRQLQEGAQRIDPAFKLENASLDEWMDSLNAAGPTGARRAIATAGKSVLAKTADALSEVYINGILSGVWTQARNTIGNAATAFATPLQMAVGGLARGDLQSAKEGLNVGLYMPSVVLDSARATIDAASRGGLDVLASGAAGRDGDFLRAISADAFGLREGSILGNIADQAGNIIRMPSQSLGLADVFFKNVLARSWIKTKAISDGAAQGLKGQALSDFVNDAIAKGFDANGHILDDEASFIAHKQTFQDTLNSAYWADNMALGLNKRSQGPAGLLVKSIVPFTKTPTNILRYSFENTPFAALSGRWRAEFAAGGIQRDLAMGRMLVGTSVLTAASVAAYNGLLTGGGPLSPKMREQWQANGWQPYSAKIGDKWVPLGNLDPFGGVIAIAADVHDIMTHGLINDDKTFHPDNTSNSIMQTIGGVAFATAHLISNRSYLQGIQQTLDALGKSMGADGEPTSQATQWVGQRVAGLVPFSAAIRSANDAFGDPIVRETKGWLDAVKRGIPGLSDTLPAKRNALGEPITKSPNPFVIPDKTSIVDQELQRLSIATKSAIGAQTPMRNIEGVVYPLQEMKTTDGSNMYEHYMDNLKNSGLRDTLTELFSSPDYAALPDGNEKAKGTKVRVVKGILDRAREFMWQKTKAEHPEFSDAVQQNHLNQMTKIYQSRGPQSLLP